MLVNVLIALSTLSMASPEVFTATVAEIPDQLIREMTGTSYEPECPTPLHALRLVTLRHWGFDDRVHTGALIVAADVADDVVRVFRAIFAARFRIERMVPVSSYGGDDDASMAANNTSAFNCRKKTGGRSWSRHSYGRAIDINPVQNPFVSKGTVAPPAGSAYLERRPGVPGLIVAGDPVVRGFGSIGWTWGGRWRSLKDYQHFSRSGR